MPRFPNWQYPKFDAQGMTEWNWVCKYSLNLQLGKNTDIGAFTFINAIHEVEIGENVQIGSHCSIYSLSTIDNKQGKVIIKENAKIGSHSIIMPGVTIGRNSVIGAFSFVNKDVPDNARALGIPINRITNV